MVVPHGETTMAQQQYPDWIWQNGNIKRWQDATAHVMSHALHYGSSVFEGIRSYATPDGAAIFRLTDHLNRLYQSARICADMASLTSDSSTRPRWTRRPSCS